MNVSQPILPLVPISQETEKMNFELLAVCIIVVPWICIACLFIWIEHIEAGNCEGCCCCCCQPKNTGIEDSNV